MDLESESSALESVEDNGLIGEVETNEDKLVSVSTTVEDDTTIDLNKQSNSPVETSQAISKGFGLRKWRRLKRRDLVKDSSMNMENSKILKRVLSGTADPHAKQMHVRSPEVNQSSLGSVGSVNDMVGYAIGGTSHGTSLAFSAGVDSDNSEDRSSKSSTAASGPNIRDERTADHLLDKERSKYLGGKSVVSSGEQKNTSVEKSKKLRGERIKIEKENSRSSMESADSKSSNFVFMQGASFTLSSGRRMMDHNDAHTSNQEEEGESQIRKCGSSGNLDPLIEAFKSYQNLQEALKRELQKFQELGKETISLLHDDEAESSSCIHVGHGRASEGSPLGESGLTSLDSEILNLMENVEQLEFKLEETKCIREAKESQIRELESTIKVPEPHNRGTEIRFEDIFQQKMEAEIEHLIFSRSVANLKRRIKLIEEEKAFAENEAHGEAETKAKNLKNEVEDLQSLKRRAIKTTSCILLQLGLLFMLFNFQLLPESETVVPT